VKNKCKNGGWRQGGKEGGLQEILKKSALPFNKNTGDKTGEKARKGYFTHTRAKLLQRGERG